MPRNRKSEPAFPAPTAADLCRRYIAGANVATVAEHYAVAAYWSSNSETDDNGGDPLDDYMAEHDTAPSPELLGTFRRAVVRFLLACERDGLDLGACDDEQIGHDLWLTRNGHGVGFWARDPETYGTEEMRDALDSLVAAMGECSLYVDVDTNTVGCDYDPMGRE
jgi:hypothetical protein